MGHFFQFFIGHLKLDQSLIRDTFLTILCDFPFINSVSGGGLAKRLARLPFRGRSFPFGILARNSFLCHSNEEYGGAGYGDAYSALPVWSHNLDYKKCTK
jgi:hypothetical protein